MSGPRGLLPTDLHDELAKVGELEERKPLIADPGARDRAGLHFASLMVTDITIGTTLRVMCGEQRIVERVAYAAVEPGVFEMRQVLSRKKQVLPYLTDLLHEL